MIPDDYQLAQTRARFQASAERRARNERLIAEGRLLQVDTPDRVNKFLARRGIVPSPTGYELAAPAAAGEQDLAAGTGEVLERIIGTSDLMGVSFLETGLRVARSVARVWVDVQAGQPAAYGTGFMVSPRLLLTNHHVLGDPAVAARSLVQFDYALQASGIPYPSATFAVDAATFHLADQHLDYALVALVPVSGDGRGLAEFGWNKLLAEEGKTIAAQYGNIIQHPNGEMKQLTLRENRIVDVLPEFLHYTSDTLGGSSGSPVYNDRWEVVALHHSGIWKTNAAGQPLTVEGTVWQPGMDENRIQWLYNEGVRVSSLVAQMRQQRLSLDRQALLDAMLQGAAPALPPPPRTRETASLPPAGPETAGGGPARTGPATWTIPITISVAVGEAGAAAGPAVPTVPALAAAATVPASPPRDPAAPASEGAVLDAARQAFNRPDVIRVRWGYVFRDGAITRERALVATVRERRSLAALRASGMDPLPDSFMGFPVEVTGPLPEDLIAQTSGPAGRELFGRLADIAQEITYVPPPGVPLQQVKAPMRVLAHLSPDIGWPTLKAFLAGTRDRLVVGMYDFGAQHIVDQVIATGRKRGFDKMTLTMRRHGSLDDGVKGDDLDNEEAATRIEAALKTRFECAFVTIGTVNGWVARAYHIKVAVRDEAAFWLSSGNWQSSNQPDIAPITDKPPSITPLRTYNREWHVIVEHAGLAQTLQAYLLNDFANNPAAAEEASAALPPLPDLFVPVAAPGLEAAAQFRYFAPFDETREFDVTPLLTPDGFVDPVVALIEEAQSEILVQNQTFDAPTKDQDALERLIDALIAQQQRGIAVRVIIRSFMPSKDRDNLERLTERGLKIGTVRFQPNSHTKGVVVDRRKVLIGSQNWSQAGVTLNRDASLLFDDAPLARYFAEVFEHDWSVLASARIGSEAIGPRLAAPGEATPAGFRRVNAAAFLSPS
ncbi:phospholipase D-like domain-containing protein [Methylobacterium sp. JK268]